MKVCMCRDFDCATTRRIIENESPANAEDVHRKAKGQDPQCGACLSTVEALKERFAKDGTVPSPLAISHDERKQAARRLGERFAAEKETADAPVPEWKERYIRRLDHP